ncbi:MAG: hypothetical protein RR387_06075, partial [Clostridiales bacterium]
EGKENIDFAVVNDGGNLLSNLSVVLSGKYEPGSSVTLRATKDMAMWTGTATVCFGSEPVWLIAYDNKSPSQQVQVGKSVLLQPTRAQSLTPQSVGDNLLVWEKKIADERKPTSAISTKPNMAAEKKATVATVNQSTPKLIVSGYRIDPLKVYAGTSFTVNLDFQNTSSSRINNLTIAISNADLENNYIIPDQNSSNTIYIKNIAPGATVQQSVKLQVRPDTPAKPQMLLLKMDYENNNANSFSAAENITIPINQEIRLDIADPRLDRSTVLVGDIAYVDFNIINKGKAAVYNLEVKLDVPGLSMAESYYVGTIGSGTQYGVDFAVLAEQIGLCQGQVVVSYEDEYGEVFTDERPLAVRTSPSAELPQSEIPLPAQSANGDNSMGKFIIIAVTAAILLLILVIMRKKIRKKRNRQGEE